MRSATPQLEDDQPRARVAVIDGLARPGLGLGAPVVEPRLQRLFGALEADFPVRFVASAEAGPEDFDGVLQLGGGPAAERAAPATLVLAAESAEGRAGPGGPLELAVDEALPAALRGRRITEEAPPGGGTQAPEGARVLARTQAGLAVWWRSAEGPEPITVSRYPLARPEDGEELRSWLRAGRFMGLLPLLAFLEGVLGERGWVRPPLRACFVLDDPNLHRPTYGFVDYARMAAHAVEHGYHVAMATVPIDNWLVNRRAADVFARNPGAISLLIHGNDHVAKELGRLDTEERAVAAIAQALRRTAALEGRSGLSVDRVLAPPHGACSEQALRAMFRLGMEAACISRPRPWLAVGRVPTALSSWYPAELVAGGMPVLPRYPLSGPREELALRAALGQPLILYGHHGDLADGLDLFAQAAADVNALGEARWERPSSIARASFATRRLGDRMSVRLHARRVSLEIPAGVTSLAVCLPEPWGGTDAHRVDLAGRLLGLEYADGRGSAAAVRVQAGERVEISLVADRPLEAERVPVPRARVWPLVRRALAEGRDRLQAGTPHRA